MLGMLLSLHTLGVEKISEMPSYFYCLDKYHLPSVHTDPFIKGSCLLVHSLLGRLGILQIHTLFAFELRTLSLNYFSF